jgi:Putative Ig domain
MFCPPLLCAPEKRVRQSNHFQCVAVVTLLLSLLLLDGCSSMSTPASANTTSATNSDSSLAISSTLPAATVGSNYDAALAVSGGTPPYAFALASGQLPTGVALGDSSGTISGTPSATGSFNFAVTVSDSTGLAKRQPFDISVASTQAAPPANTFANLQHGSGWASYGQGPPDFVDCSPSPCDGISFSMSQNVSSPSMSGEAAQFNLGGTAVYTDALFNNHLIGDLSSQGMPDANHTLVAGYHNFTYDVYFYGTNLELSQAVEFDINQFFNNLGFIWGHECRISGGHEWDVWNNLTAHWTPTGIACNPVDNAWNHLTIQVQRTADNQLLYQSITLNGVTSTLNQYYDPGSAPGWYGVTVNYQMDGNYQQSPYSVYLDNLTFTYQ